MMNIVADEGTDHATLLSIFFKSQYRRQTFRVIHVSELIMALRDMLTRAALSVPHRKRQIG